MIENERQLQVTKEWLNRFNNDLAKAEKERKAILHDQFAGRSIEILNIQIAAIKGMVADLESQIKEYEAKQ